MIDYVWLVIVIQLLITLYMTIKLNLLIKAIEITQLILGGALLDIEKNKRQE